MEETKQNVYMILIDYSTDDYEGVDTFLYHTREKALQELKKILKNERRNTWVKDAYTKKKLDKKHYELDTNMQDCNKDECDLWWNFRCKNDFYLHTFIDMKKIEIN